MALSYCSSSAISERSQLIQPAVCSLYRQHRHCHATKEGYFSVNFITTHLDQSSQKKTTPILISASTSLRIT